MSIVVEPKTRGWGGPHLFLRAIAFAGLLLYLCACLACHDSGEKVWLHGKGLRLKAKAYRSTKVSSHPVLIVVLHGDSPEWPPSYQYSFAHKAAEEMEDVIVVGLLRPGYKDGDGDRSDGVRGRTTGDNYTPEVVDAVAEATEQLKAGFHPVHTVLVGHSGGATIIGDLIARWPSEVDAALMVSCSCDLVAWRRHMQKIQNNDPVWSQSVTSLSPIDLSTQVPHSIRVRLLVGKEDPVTPPELSQHYADALRNQGDDVTLTIVPGLEHNILSKPVVYNALKKLVRELKEAS